MTMFSQEQAVQLHGELMQQVVWGGDVTMLYSTLLSPFQASDDVEL